MRFFHKPVNNGPVRLNKQEPNQSFSILTVLIFIVNLIIVTVRNIKVWFVKHPIVMFIVGLVIFVLVGLIFIGPTEAGRIYNPPVNMVR